MTDWLTETLIATSGLMALVLVIREPVRRRFGSQVAYALWLLPAARAVLPSFTETIERTVPAPLTLPAAPTVSYAAQAGAASTDWTTLALALWLAGAAVMLLRGLAIYRAQRRGILRHSTQLATLQGIRIVRSEQVRGPIAFGILDRVIVVPLDFDQKFTARQRCFALEHELAHHRCGDLTANLFAFVLLCLQWFNPLAWAAHAAFRFDQEAACDARVLDKAEPGERVSYGAAIAKAASGRTFLFSGALDRPSTLSRRLTIMTRSQSRQARKLGFSLIGGGLLVALPLTASRAVDYVDVVAPAAPAAPNTPSAPIPAMLVPLAPAPPVAPSAPRPAAVMVAAKPAASVVAVSRNSHADQLSIERDFVIVDGKRKKWEELTPAERAKVRNAISSARKSIDEQVARLPEQMAELERTRAQFANGDFRRQMDEARASMERALVDIHRQRAVLRATGQVPDKIMVDIRRSLKDIDAAKIDQVVRSNMAAINPEKLRSDILGASRSIQEVEERLRQAEQGNLR